MNAMPSDNIHILYLICIAIALFRLPWENAETTYGPHVTLEVNNNSSAS